MRKDGLPYQCISHELCVGVAISFCTSGKKIFPFQNQRCRREAFRDDFSDRLSYVYRPNPRRPSVHLLQTGAHFRRCHPVRFKRLSFITTPFPPSPLSIAVCVTKVQQYVGICLIWASKVKGSHFLECSNMEF